MKTTIISYWLAEPDMVIRRKHTSYSYWNFATSQWYGYPDAKWLKKTPITAEQAQAIIKEHS